MAPATPRLTCADLPPRNAGGLQARSPQLHRLAQHQKHLLELQQRRELHQQPAEEEEGGKEARIEELHMKEKAKRREDARRRAAAAEEEEEARRRRAAEEEVEERRKGEAERQRRDQLQLQLQQQQEELQQIMQWQQELEGQRDQQGPSVAALLLSPSSGLCTIYEALENSEEEVVEEVKELGTHEEQEEPFMESDARLERVASDEDDDDQDSSLSSQSPPSPPPPQPDSPRAPSSHQAHAHPLDWGKKVDMVQQLINQSLLLTAEGCCCAASSSSSPMFLLPGGAGGTLSPLESSLWPRLLPPLTPPSSATVTSVSSYSPEAAGHAPQGEWTVVELETHH